MSIEERLAAEKYSQWECYQMGKNDAIKQALEWMKSKTVFCHAGQYNKNEVSESEFLQTMKQSYNILK